MNIALGICGMSLDAFRKMTPAEFSLIARAKIEQRNEEWKFQDLLNGVRCSLLANINRSSNTRQYTPEDFMIIKEDKKQDPEDIVRVLSQIAGGHHD